MTAPDFKELARAWLVRAQGHARAPHEESLADELRRVYDLALANAIEAVAVFDEADPQAEALEAAILRIRLLSDKPPDPRGN